MILLVNEGVPNPTLWYPQILGVLVVVAAIGLFCGSIYLLLATNLGARLGFLVAGAALTGFMLLLSSLWFFTTSPLNTFKGRPPSWKAVESTGPNVAKSKIPAVAADAPKAKTVSTIEASNVKAAVDAVVVKPAEGPPGVTVANTVNPSFQVYQATTDYLMTHVVETGGGLRYKFDADGEWPWLHFSFHEPKYAIATICPVDKAKLQVPFGDPIPNPTCDTSKPVSNLVLERDLGSLRVPPLVTFASSSVLFALFLLCLHWRERDLQEAEAAAAAPSTPSEPAAGELEPANA